MLASDGFQNPIPPSYEAYVHQGPPFMGFGNEEVVAALWIGW